MVAKKFHFFIVEDDPQWIELYKNLLEEDGHKVSWIDKSELALEEIEKLQPDCILCDLIMPRLDGLELFQKVRTSKTIKEPYFIIITSKQYQYDVRRARELGVDGYINKSAIKSETFVSEILEIIADEMVVQFWGIRGTFPVPGKNSIRYGGNTNCVTLKFNQKHFFIFDAGTGIKELSNFLIHQNKFPISAKIFISHPHWDHINGIPYFAPFYIKGNEFEIFGSNHPSASLEKLVSEQMNGVYFPVEIKEFAAKIDYHPLTEEKFEIDEDIKMKTILLTHPGRCLGYRIDYKNRSFCYITDNEIYFEDSPFYSQFEIDRLIHFIQEANLVIMDSTYTDKVYPSKINWGHSCVTRVVDIADKAKIDRLCLYHHDPDQTDNDIDAKLKQAQEILKSKNSKTTCIAPQEGDKIIV